MNSLRRIATDFTSLSLLALNCFSAHASPSIPEVTYYSSNFEEARSRFREAATNLSRSVSKAVVWHFEVPSQKDKDLTVDYLFLPAQEKAERLLVITSGVHGMEAFAGSAVGFPRFVPGDFLILCHS